MHEGPALQDRALLEAARAGSADAFRELWRQHHRAAHRYASALTRRFDADDLVSEAFLRVFSALRSGGGPGEALRPYLFVTIRNIAIKWAKQPGVRSLEEIDEPAYDVDLGGALMQAADRQKLQDALGSLPAQWQQILWATEVKGQRPAELAPTLGLQPNSVAALAYRAREALRHAWVQVHMGDDLGDGEHRWVRERAGRYVYHALTNRQRHRFQAHLDVCERCDLLIRDAKHLSILPVGVLALLLPFGGVAAPVVGVTGDKPLALSARLGVRLRHAAASFTRVPTTSIGLVALATGVIAIGAVAVVRTVDDFTPFRSMPDTSSVFQAPAFPAPTDEPQDERPTPLASSDPTPTLTPPASNSGPLPRVGEYFGSPAVRDLVPEDKVVPNIELTQAPGVLNFTLLSISPGNTGTAIVEIVNDGDSLIQNAESMRGSSALFVAPPGLTFEPQDRLVNDYEYAGYARSKSAVEFSSCATADHAHVLRCDVVAADTTPSANTGWMWASGDTRRVYLKVAVDDDVETRTLAGSAQLRFLSDAGVLRVFDRPWQVDVLPVLDTSTPLIDTIEPTGDPVVIGGTTEPGRALTIWSDDNILARAIADVRGRWRATVPWGTRGTLTVRDF